ncbi:YihY/virulence factor BrkB family protein [Qipengyuania sediminis]|uniref:YihY/virulence factor BrkB family protein n=1 Tax=Qipengyuania sediminis TaxID=1532023 RepID=UPI0010594729|nr:YihY/virulence factor BrkB family protein [Qipengyuania sediminis]
MNSPSNGGRGRSADTPGAIPARGWKDIAWRVKDEVDDDHVATFAAGVAFFGLLALFPAVGATIALAALAVDPVLIQAQLGGLLSALPPEAGAILQKQLADVVATTGGGMGVAALIGLLVSLYSASKGMKVLIEGMNLAYDEDEKRGFLKLNLLAIGMTLGAIIGIIAALAAMVAVPAILSTIGLSQAGELLLRYGRWLVLAGLALLGLAALYRYGPSRDKPRWRWVTPGSLLATVLWIAGSGLFSIYASNFGSYNETYGTLGGVVVLLTWLWLSAFIVLLGAEVNAEIEHQTARDTTVGADRPLGARGAAMADSVGETKA